jgi:prenyltransferase beta subunit
MLALMFALALGQTADEKKASVAFVLSLEDKDGGFRQTAKDVPDLRATSSALRALRYFGGKPAFPDAHKKFVVACHDDKTGGFRVKPGGAHDSITTAVGLMALKELKVDTAPYEKAAIVYFEKNADRGEEIRMAAAGLEAIGKKSGRNEKWIESINRSANADGSFASGENAARSTGGMAALILRLGGEVKRDAVLKTMRDGQRKDGGFGLNKGGSDLESSYRVMRAFVMLKARPERPEELRAFIAKCRHASGGYGTQPGAAPTASGTYFAAIVLHWLDEK